MMDLAVSLLVGIPLFLFGLACYAILRCIIVAILSSFLED
jgi:hypothetical protein